MFFFAASVDVRAQERPPERIFTENEPFLGAADQSKEMARIQSIRNDSRETEFRFPSGNSDETGIKSVIDSTSSTQPLLGHTHAARAYDVTSRFHEHYSVQVTDVSSENQSMREEDENQLMREEDVQQM